jgi:hypothetical protein
MLATNALPDNPPLVTITGEWELGNGNLGLRKLGLIRLLPRQTIFFCVTATPLLPPKYVFGVRKLSFVVCLGSCSTLIYQCLHCLDRDDPDPGEHSCQSSGGRDRYEGFGIPGIEDLLHIVYTAWYALEPRSL